MAVLVAGPPLSTAQTVSSAPGRGEIRGLVQRSPHPMRGTLIDARLPPAACTLLDRADVRVAALDAASAHELSAEEQGTLQQLLIRVSDAAHRNTTPPPVR